MSETKTYECPACYKTSTSDEWNRATIEHFSSEERPKSYPIEGPDASGFLFICPECQKMIQMEFGRLSVYPYADEEI